MSCSPNREAVRAVKHYHTRARQTLIKGKNYSAIIKNLSFKHKQFQIIYSIVCRNVHRNIMKRTT